MHAFYFLLLYPQITELQPNKGVLPVEPFTNDMDAHFCTKPSCQPPIQLDQD